MIDKCERRCEQSGEWICDRCVSLWFGELAKTDWRPSECPLKVSTAATQAIETERVG